MIPSYLPPLLTDLYFPPKERSISTYSSNLFADNFFTMFFFCTDIFKLTITYIYHIFILNHHHNTSCFMARTKWWSVTRGGSLKKLSLASLAKLSQLIYSWLRFGMASAGYCGLGVHDRLVYTAVSWHNFLTKTHASDARNCTILKRRKVPRHSLV